MSHDPTKVREEIWQKWNSSAATEQSPSSNQMGMCKLPLTVHKPDVKYQTPSRNPYHFHLSCLFLTGFAFLNQSCSCEFSLVEELCHLSLLRSLASTYKSKQQNQGPRKKNHHLKLQSSIPSFFLSPCIHLFWLLRSSENLFWQTRPGTFKLLT